jgi:hypothetical protein
MFEVEVKTIPHGFGASTNVKHLHLAPSNDLGFQLRLPNLGLQMLLQWHDDGSISPSTAYEGCQTPGVEVGDQQVWW